MGQIIVEVMPKPEILDPQGKAVGSALPRLGITGFTEVRQGKCFHLTVDGPVTDELLEQARHAAEEVLSNPIIEDVVRVEELTSGSSAGPETNAKGGCGCGHGHGHGHAHGHQGASEADEPQPIEMTTSQEAQAETEGNTGCGCGHKHGHKHGHGHGHSAEDQK